MDYRAYWILMQQVFGAGSYKPWFIFNSFSGGLEEFFSEGSHLWNSLDYITEKEARLLHSQSIDNAQLLLELGERMGQQVITPQCEIYPEALKNIYDPPAVIYLKGSLPDVDRNPAIAVVGTRKASELSVTAATSISYQLGLMSAIVVSGGALGVDSAAHMGAIRAMGSTIAVLPCGINDGYLIENFKLRERIAENGALLSEYPMNTQVSKGTFQVRNRLISGLCCGTLVVEAATRSGALITARHAKEQSRDVFVFAGPEGDPRYAGCRGLMADGAKPVTNAEEILDEYALRFQERHYRVSEKKTKAKARKRGISKLPIMAEPSDNADGAIAEKAEYSNIEAETIIKENESGPVKAVLVALAAGELHVSEIQRQTGLSSPILLATLTQLELSGKVRSLAGRRYGLTK